MVEKYSRFDAAEFLGSEEAIAEYLADSAESGDPTVMIAALAAVARARNMSELARKSGMTREGLYKALAPTGNPSFANVGHIARAMGYRLTLVPQTSSAEKTRASQKVAKKKSPAKTTRKRSARPSANAAA